MNHLVIDIDDQRTSFRPGERVSGSVAWELEEEATVAELRLFWMTQGRGDRDLVVVQRERFDAPERAAAHRFHFELPLEPYSFSGKLISLVWSLELSVMPSDDATRTEITISPTGEEIRLADIGANDQA
jgi:hypothetical protein